MSRPKPAEYRFCGRIFSSDEIEIIRGLIASDDRPNRSKLSRMVCEELNWLRPDGRLKDMSCRVAMLRMHRQGLIELPSPQMVNGNGRRRPCLTAASEFQLPIAIPVGQLGDVELRQVVGRKESRLWNELIERHHYLGYEPLAGAQIRYLVFADGRLLAAMGFGASAWMVAPRDDFIGWTHEQRRLNLQLVVNNARYLIMPWVHSQNLASHRWRPDSHADTASSSRICCHGKISKPDGGYRALTFDPLSQSRPAPQEAALGCRCAQKSPFGARYRDLAALFQLRSLTTHLTRQARRYNAGIIRDFAIIVPSQHGPICGRMTGFIGGGPVAPGSRRNPGACSMMLALSDPGASAAQGGLGRPCIA